MRKIVLVLALAGSLAYGQQLKPDLALEKQASDTFHGVTLEDPYQYMENLEDERVISWMRANAEYAEDVLNDIPGKQELFNTLKEMVDRRAASIYNVAITADDTYFYVKRVPGEEIGKVYKRDGYDGEETLFLDPEAYNTESEEVVYTVENIIPNHSGSIVAIGLSPGGSENQEIIFMNASGERLPDKLELAGYIRWTKTDDTVLYNQLNSADLKDKNRQIATRVRAHKIGTDPASDMDFFSKHSYPALGIKDVEFPIADYDRSSDRIIGIAATVDKKITLFSSDPSVGPDKEWQTLARPADSVVWAVTDSEHVYYHTFKGAPNFKIVKSSLSAPAASAAQIAVPEFEDEIINDMQLTKDGLYFNTTKNGVEAKVYFLAKGAAEPVALDLPFSAGDASISVKGDEFSDVWITIEGWTSPFRRFKYDPKDGTFTHEPLSTPVDYPELNNLVAEEVLVESHDGVMVPVSIIRHKDTPMDGSSYATIYGYGSYGISMEPFFSPITLAYTTKGGILVVPHVRGGGELGDAWHMAGQKLNKPNTWKDAIATAEYLIEKGYTKADKLSIFGGSAGGIFVGRSITDRPDLFAAGVPLVGAMNTVRMEFTPNGPVNAPEFGTVEDPDEFRGLLEMDSFHHLEAGTEYPGMLITSGFNDPRVIAWQPAKFAAKMQRAQSGDEPILFLTNFDEGHGGRTTITNTLDLFSNIFAFMYWQSGHPDFQPGVKVKG